MSFDIKRLILTFFNEILTISDEYWTVFYFPEVNYVDDHAENQM